MFQEAFGVLRVGGALEHVWGITWCLEVWSIGALEVYKCTFGGCKC